MEPSLQSFYADIKAAHAANVPVELTSRSLLQPAALPSESEIHELAAEQSVANVDARHQAALGIHAQLGSMVPVLDGLSARAIAVGEFSTIIRRVLWYLSLLLLVTLFGLYYFGKHVVPKYMLMREDMESHYGFTGASLDTFPYLIPLIIVVAVLLVISLLLLMTDRNSLLIGWFGGRKYVRLRVASAAARTLGLLATHDNSLSEATQNTATLYALDKVGQREFKSSFGEATDAKTYQIISQYWSLKAAKNFEQARAVVPMVVLTVVGGGVAMAYGFLLYGPFIGLVQDFVKAGVPS